MKVSHPKTFNIMAVVLITGALTYLYYVHESFPKPLRAITAILATPTVIASGISHYLHLGIPVYETPWAIFISNLTAALVIVYLVTRISKIKKRYPT